MFPKRLKYVMFKNCRWLQNPASGRVSVGTNGLVEEGKSTSRKPSVFSHEICGFNQQSKLSQGNQSIDYHMIDILFANDIPMDLPRVKWGRIDLSSLEVRHFAELLDWPNVRKRCEDRGPDRKMGRSGVKPREDGTSMILYGGFHSHWGSPK